MKEKRLTTGDAEVHREDVNDFSYLSLCTSATPVFGSKNSPVNKTVNKLVNKSVNTLVNDQLFTTHLMRAL